MAESSYFSKQSLQGYGSATVAVTLLANFFNVLHFAITDRDPSNGVMVAVGAVLSIGIVVIFAKRETELPKPQQWFILLLNAILLFNTNAGVNTVLHGMGSGSVPSVAGDPPTVHAGFASFVKGLFVPRTPWISPDIPRVVTLQTELNAVKEEVSSLVVLDTIHARIDTLVREQQRNNDHLRALNLELDTVRSRYQRSLVANQTQAVLFASRLEELRVNIRTNPAEALQGATELRDVVMEQQQVEEGLQQQVQQQIVDQRAQQVQQQMQQVQQQQQQALLQQQVQQQQQQLVRVRKRLFLN